MESSSSSTANSRMLKILLVEIISGLISLGTLTIGLLMIRDAITPSLDKLNNPNNDGSNDDDDNSKNSEQKIISKLVQRGVPNHHLTHLSHAERALLHNIVFPDSIQVTFDDIGGLDPIKQELFELVVDPIRRPDLYYSAKNALLQPPKGLLLYGPPGTGKTMLTKALAHESGANFLNLSPSTFLSKYVGETNELVRAAFDLAHKIQPTILFVDEMDSLFRERSSGDHEVYRDMKAEFMQLWDGVFTDHPQQIMVIGATNRPYELDPAIQRRMPRAFLIGLPKYNQRISILQTILRTCALSPTFDFDRIAQVTPEYSGSDLKEVCRAAMLLPLREALGLDNEDDNSGDLRLDELKDRITGEVHLHLRPLTTEDVLITVDKVPPSTSVGEAYEKHLYEQEGGASTRNPRQSGRDGVGSKIGRG